ncbi:MAG: hypothetical protein GQ574_12285 [Crocinitomix sp.]|nr:hypothetical protein [Crocinitomix sp.]
MKYYTVFIIGLLFSCSGTPSLVLNEEEPIEIEYAFSDASVSPEYHRSYTISIDKSLVSISVDSYGDILTVENQPIDIDEFTALIETINASNLTSGRNTPDEPCDGGTGESLTIKESGAEVYNGYFDHCADDVPASMGDIGVVIDAIHALAPNLEEMLD